MMRSVILGTLACLLVNASAGASRVTLTNIACSEHAGYSRVTLTFDGEVRYSPFAGDGTVRLGLSHTAVGIPMKARRQAINGGLVSSVSVTPLPDDSVVVAIALHGPSTYRCILPASGNALYVDILPAADGAAGEHAVRPTLERRSKTAKPVGASVGAAITRTLVRKEQVKAAPVAKKSAPETPVAPLSSVGVVDIPAIAREQVHVECAEASVRAATPHAAAQHLPPAAALGLSALAAFIMIGSGVALSFVLRTTPPHPVQDPRPVHPPASTGLTLEPEFASSRNDVLIDDADDDDEARFAHDTSLQLARTFRRGSEEITLARRLHTQATPQLSGARMDETLSRATTTNQRLHIARKLGVGRGEMDLAAKLRTIRPAEKKEGVPQ